MTSPGSRLLAFLAAAALLCMGVTLACRVQAIRASAALAPGTAATSGCEEESLQAVWRGIHGEPIYVDPSRIPYAAAYFNWLFYGVHTAAGRLAPAASDLPTVGRLLTLGGALAGAAVAAWFLATLGPPGDRGRRALAAALGAAVFLGPLAGWWSLTVRPDIPALAAEAGALAILLAGRRRWPLAAPAYAAVLFFCAWSFKQTYIAGGAAAGCLLLWRRDWRGAGVLAVVYAGLCVLTLAAMGPAYRTALTETARAADYFPAIALENALGAAKKCLPLLLALPAIVLACRRRTATTDPAEARNRDALLVGCLGTAFSLLIALPASAKFGAASNYYFSPALLLTIAAVAALNLRPGPWNAAVVAASLALLAALPLTGYGGRLTLQPEAGVLARRWEWWRAQPEPRFSADLRLNLSWLNPGSPPLVLGYDYAWERRTGRSFEADGIGGLIRTGYFASLMLPAETSGSYDSGDLSRYERIAERDGFALYRRR